MTNAQSDVENILTITKHYDKETGILTLGKQKSYTNTKDSKCTLYNIYKIIYIYYFFLNNY